MSSPRSKSLKSIENNNELEEGEMVSPSPSPNHDTKKDRSRYKRREDDNRKSPSRQDKYHKSSRHRSDSESSGSTRKRRSSTSRRRYRHYRSRSRSHSPSRRKARNRSRERSLDRKRRRSPRSDKRSRTKSDQDYRKARESRDRKPSPEKKVKKTLEKKPKPLISATAPNADTPEQYKVFTIMFNQLAHANKKRGDGQTNILFSIMDHFHALCDYILNFYYVDKSSNDKISFKQASVAWKSLFPFADSLMAKLEQHEQYGLYGLCARLVSLIRYYIYNRMTDSTRTLISNHVAQPDLNVPESKKCVQVSDGLFREFEKAQKWYIKSEKYLSFATLASQFPRTFQDVCIQGNLSAGISIGGEAGVSVDPMFPFTPYSPLNLTAIVSKCILSEFVVKNELDYSPISQPDEYMK